MTKGTEVHYAPVEMTTGDTDRLVVVETDRANQQGSSIALEAGIAYAVGRPPNACGWVKDGRKGIVFHDHKLSRIHAVIEPHPEGWFVRDVGSANGTFVNGIMVKDAILVAGDRLTFGGTTFELRLRAETSVEPTAP